MRADRLLSILLLLQARGRMTARALARDLEVSVRTIYRDIDALSMAGVPVYTDRGPGGGVSLLDSYRTQLTGLTREEARALLMLNVPEPLADLGLGGQLAAAIRKLAASLPSSFRGDDERVRQRIHLDPTSWTSNRERVPHLETIHRAVWADRLLQLRYQLPFGAHVDWRAAPYGLVAKAQAWYLVCERDGSFRVLNLLRVLEARLLDESFEREAGFDLASHWRAWCADHEASRPCYLVTVRLAPSLLPFLNHEFGDRLASTGLPDSEGWTEVTLGYESFDEARRHLLGFGGAVEALAPPALRLSLRDFAEQSVRRYNG